MRSRHSHQARRDFLKSLSAAATATLALPQPRLVADAVIEQIEISVKYAGYIVKQNDEVERAARYEHLVLPAELDYAQVHALSYEVRQTLSRHRPETLGQASRMSGVTPAAISLLLVHLKKGRFAGFGDAAETARDLRGATALADAA